MIRRKIRMQGDAEQASLRGVVHRKVERDSHYSAIDYVLDVAGALLEDQKIVVAEKRHGGGCDESGDNGPHGEVRVDHAGGRRLRVQVSKPGSAGRGEYNGD